MDVLHVDHIRLGASSCSGHEVYPDALYLPSQPVSFFPVRTKIIFKKNKFNQAKYSYLEVLFTQITRLFLTKNLTSAQTLVVNQSGQVVGTATEHICYQIAKKEGLSAPFYTVRDSNSLVSQLKGMHVTQAEDIPIYFLNRLPQGFFQQLMNEVKQGVMRLDYKSLASILTTCYSLEEDDLHKANFGFYMIQKELKPEIVFFKIDHDLMFVDSIMSFCTSRPFHLFHDDGAFAVTEEDLLQFPDIRHSANFFWPTRKNYPANPLDNKEYHHAQETEAFARLKDIPEFKRAKWLSFYKHILAPVALIQSAVQEASASLSAADRARAFLVIQAMVARQAHLRAVLFSVAEFRDFITQLTAEEQEELSHELLLMCPQTQQQTMSQCIHEQNAFYQHLCRNHVFTLGDTPLHCAVKLGDFRYEDSINDFNSMLNKTNSLAQTPLDVTLMMREATKNPCSDVRSDAHSIAAFLYAQGGVMNTMYVDEHTLQVGQDTSEYIYRATQVKTYEALRALLSVVGEDPTYCLKGRKNLAIRCVSVFIEQNQTHPYLQGILLKIKSDIANSDTHEEHVPLRYIRQLRSRLWIIRQIRGLFGWTSTQGAIGRLIDDAVAALELNKRENNDRGWFSWFKSSVQHPNDVTAVDPCSNRL